jgi:RNA polymerase-binding transcription factor DksA
MPHTLKPDELASYRRLLDSLRTRLQGDVVQMTDQALQATGGDAAGNLSRVPLHLADIGSESFDQEFTLGLIENEQETLAAVNAALGRLDAGTFGRCAECGEPIPRARLRALPYASHCVDCASKLESPSS